MAKKKQDDLGAVLAALDSLTEKLTAEIDRLNAIRRAMKESSK